MNREFFFYRSYITDVEGCFTEKQYREYLEAIISYGVTGTYQIDDPYILPIFIQRKASIDASQSRYMRAVINGRKGGRKLQVKKWEIIEALKLGVLVEDLPRFFGCSEKTISRRFSKQELEQLVMLREIRVYVQRNNRNYSTEKSGKGCDLTKYDYFLEVCDEYGIESDYLEYFRYLPRHSGHKWEFGYSREEN